MSSQELKPFFMKEVGSHFDDFVTNLIEKSASLDNGGDLRAPPEHGKIFITRRSLLDELFEVDHIRTIYHMFIALLILFILSTLVVDYIDEGRLVLEFNLISYAFGKFPVAMWTWWAMFLCTLSIPYFIFQHWARGYSKSTHPIRLIMKAHSFVRENVPRVLKSANEKSSTAPVPTVNQYLYFLTPTVRWRYVAMQFAQVFGCLFYVYYIFERLCAPLFRNIKQEPFSARVLVLCVFNSILPGVLILLLFFFAFLHCWLNAFAEMLRFGDRMFYKDWWNSTSYSNYYRTWNVVVHDWLYYYAYKDFLWRFKSAAMLAVFAVSAVVHEYALAVCLNFFYPVLFVLFMFFGMAFNFIVNDSRKRPIWNVLMWTSLFAGNGVILCFYSQEWYARQQCPLKNPTFLDYIRPRSWTCRYDMFDDHTDWLSSE
ncbi:hypothetical protein MC885_016556, partial [Smutsia gigantea]